jgi:hypothetical protein
LAHFILPQVKHEAAQRTDRQFEDQTTISGPALEDSMYVASLQMLIVGFELKYTLWLTIFPCSFRFLTPAPITNDLPLNDVARQAGANPISLPNGSSVLAVTDGEISPTGVSDFCIYPSWVDGTDPPSWYAKGADVDALLDVSDTLDWLADTGDLQETYEPSSDLETGDLITTKERLGNLGGATNHTSVVSLPHVESVVPPLPSLFGDSSLEIKQSGEPASSACLKMSASATSIDVFENSMEEHDFVSTILETANESSVSLPALN